MSIILAPEGRIEFMLGADLLQEALGRIRGRQVKRVDQYRAKRKGQDTEKRHAALGAAAACSSAASEARMGTRPLRSRPPDTRAKYCRLGSLPRMSEGTVSSRVPRNRRDTLPEKSGRCASVCVPMETSM